MFLKATLASTIHLWLSPKPTPRPWELPSTLDWAPVVTSALWRWTLTQEWPHWAIKFPLLGDWNLRLNQKMPCWEEMDVAFGTRGDIWGQQRVGPVWTNEGKPACAKRGHTQAPDPGEQWRWALQSRRGGERGTPWLGSRHFLIHFYSQFLRRCCFLFLDSMRYPYLSNKVIPYPYFLI